MAGRLPTNMLNTMIGRVTRLDRQMNDMEKRMLEQKQEDETTINLYQNLIWRSYDGSGNNLVNPNYGMVGIPLVRQSFADYGDGSSSLAVRGAKNTNPRIISNSICKQTTDIPNSLGLSDMVWGWGQFLDHEVDLTPDDSGETSNITTPSTAVDPNEEYPGRTIHFVRSRFISGTEPREQPNVLSAFIDATNVYGFTTERSYALRTLDGTGKLKTTVANNNEEIMPYNTAGLSNANPTGLPTDQLFLAGDIRANENVLLISLHTLFVREHNRLCDEIVNKEPNLAGQDELIYQHARRMICGFMQSITYNEFLPALLGNNGLSEYSGYDDTIDASIATEFSTAGYRIGHTMLSSELQIGTIKTLALRDAFFTPSYIQTNGINDVLYGATKHIMQEIDGKVVDDVRNFLFGSPTSLAMLDLASLNIQRGRDHGLPGYNAVRVSYGLASYNNFSQITSDTTVQSKLASLYDSVDEIDPWIGCLVEDHLPGAGVGELVATILKDQFGKLREGDRFYYENNVSLSDGERSEIRNTKLSDIINRNTNVTISEDAFHV